MTIKVYINKDSEKPYLCKGQGKTGRGVTAAKAIHVLLRKLKQPVPDLEIGKVIYL